VRRRPRGSHQHALAHDDDLGLDLLQLVRVVGLQVNASHAERPQHGGHDAVLAPIVVEAEHQVRLDRVEPALLQALRANLVDEPGAPEAWPSR
jgi:hypothetical protein